jgi:HD-like signal output (HDOD) protein
MDDETAARIETIELTLMKDSVLGFDPSILSVLDDVEIGQREIENLKSRLGSNIFTYLFNIANSAYHGSIKMGPVLHFFDVVNRLGMQHTVEIMTRKSSLPNILAHPSWEELWLMVSVFGMMGRARWNLPASFRVWAP